MEATSAAQEEELLALTAIYGESAVTDLRGRHAWKVWRPLELSVRLLPSSGASCDPSAGDADALSVTLVARCGRAYPRTAPAIALEAARGLADADAARLSARLQTAAEKLRGEPMLLDLCELVREFLHERRTGRTTVARSFHEGMVSEERKRAKSAGERDEMAAATERDEIARELQRREQRRLQRARSPEQAQATPEGQLDTTVQTPAQPPVGAKAVNPVKPAALNVPADGGKQLKGVKFHDRTVRTLTERADITLNRGTHKLCSEWVAVDETAKPELLLVVSEWTFDAKKACPKADFGSLLLKLQSVEQEFRALAKVSHENLLNYCAFKWSQTPKMHSVSLIRRHISGAIPMCDNLKSNIPLSLRDAQTLSCQILEATVFLHGKGILHREISPECIFYLPEERKYFLADVSLRARVRDLAEGLSPGNADESVVAGAGKPSKKSDVFMFGLSLLSLVEARWMGSPTQMPSPSRALHPALVEFVDAAFSRADNAQAANLLQHHFLTDDLDASSSVKTCSEEAAAVCEEEPFPSATAHISRLKHEFHELKWIGKGGFGDVIQVRNKLDGSVYAIKKVLLDSTNGQLSERIMREVKLACRLNHEHVVRYYNSWIESVPTPPSTADSSTAPTTTTDETEANVNGATVEDAASWGDSLLPANLRGLERKGAPLSSRQSVEWSASYSTTQRRPLPSAAAAADSSDEESSSESECASLDLFFGKSLGRREQSSSAQIVFERGPSGAAAAANESTPNDCEGASNQRRRDTQMLYIQMEFCENSTLRHLIDRRFLLENSKEAWRIYRELLEGLKHIHSHGIIHRDIKPVNVLLDGQLHAKIADFGLATDGKLGVDLNRSLTAADERDGLKSPDLLMTTQIGTALYVAPELAADELAATAVYSKKVDIFSAGIVLFELFYEPLSAGMRRARVLSDVRKASLPADLGATLGSSEERQRLRRLLAWSLSSEPSARPTAADLLASELLPAMEETDFQTTFRKVMADERSSQYRWTVEAFFNRLPSTTLEYCYDKNMFPTEFKLDKCLVEEYVRDGITAVFKKHGALRVSTPLLRPRNKADESAQEEVSGSCTLVEESGLVVQLPTDMRTGFSRLVARSAINRLKRYTFDKVFVSDAEPGCHPKELTECAFDVVSPSAEAAAVTAELFSVLKEILGRFGCLREARCLVVLNHWSLLRAVAAHHGVVDSAAFERLVGLLERRRRSAAIASVEELQTATRVSEPAAKALLSALSGEESLGKIANQFRVITQRKTETSLLAKEALRELDALMNAVTCLKIPSATFCFAVSPGLCYRPALYRSTVFKAFLKVPRKRKDVEFGVAVGGRFERLIETARRPGLDAEAPSQLSAAGLSVAFDRLVAAVGGGGGGGGGGDRVACGAVDALVCSTDGARSTAADALALVQSLWAADVRADILHEPVAHFDDLLDFCRRHGVQHVLALKQQEPGLARVHSWDGERFLVAKGDERLPIATDGERSVVAALRAAAAASPAAAAAAARTTSAEQPPAPVSAPAATSANLNIHYLLPKEKTAYNSRKRYEAQIAANLANVLPKLAARVTLDVLATELPAQAVATLAATVNTRSEADFRKSEEEVLAKLSKHKHMARQAIEFLRDLLFESSDVVRVAAVYSCSDDFVRLLM